jgi:protein CpxP
MTENQLITTPSETIDEYPRSSRGVLILLGVVVFLGLSALASMAFSETGDDWGPDSWHRGGFMGGSLDPAQIEDHADRAVRHLAIDIDATPDQQQKLEAIVKAALKDLLPMREHLKAGREQARALLTGPQVNRDEIEKLRAQQMALIDSASKRVVQALADAADVLTPDQRREVADRFPPGGFWHRWHRG